MKTILIAVCLMLCGCGLTIRPSDISGVSLTSPISTNNISSEVISGAINGILAAFGIPEVGPLAGGLVVGLIWFWRHKRKQDEKGNVPRTPDC